VAVLLVVGPRMVSSCPWSFLQLDPDVAAAATVDGGDDTGFSFAFFTSLLSSPHSLCFYCFSLCLNFFVAGFGHNSARCSAGTRRSKMFFGHFHLLDLSQPWSLWILWHSFFHEEAILLIAPPRLVSAHFPPKCRHSRRSAFSTLLLLKKILPPPISVEL
jgi:hypothetical protein